MKKRTLAMLLVFALALTALAGCGQDSGNGSGGDGEQLLEKGYYEVLDEDDETAGYLRVTSSKIYVYDARGNETDVLRYDYDAKKELYTLDDGELFGGEEFTVEKSRRTLTLITEDDDEYTLEEIDKDDLPSGSGGSREDTAAETQAPGDTPVPSQTEAPAPPQTEAPAPAPDGIRPPAGAFECYSGMDAVGYLVITGSTITEYELDGYEGGTYSYTYDPSDGLCTLDNGETLQFLREGSNYYLANPNGTERYWMDEISASEIPVYGSGSGFLGPVSTYYIAGNGTADLYAALPDALYGNLYTENDTGSVNAQAEYYDNGSGTTLYFYAIIASGETMREAVEEARDAYDGAYDSDEELVFNYFCDEFVNSSLDDDYFLDEYFGAGMTYSPYTYNAYRINGRPWHDYDVYAYSSDEDGFMTLLVSIDGDTLVLALVAGITTDYSAYFSDMKDAVDDIVDSIEVR